MNDSFEDESESGWRLTSGSVAGSETDHDPWLNFHVASEGDPDSGDEPLPEGEVQSDWSCDSPQPQQPEHYAANWPSDRGEDPAPASLLAADLFRRRQRGDTASLSGGEPCGATLDNSLDSLVSCKLPMASVDGPSQSRGRFLRLPEVGSTLFGFQLRYPLGRGAFARVFLAEQSDLAGRPVVLKVSAIEGTEPQTLAQLQHTNIVPIYSAHEDPRAGLRAVCMPYFGGASLSAILEQLWGAGPPPCRGQDFIAALETVQSPPPGRFTNGVQIDLASAMSWKTPAASIPAEAPANQYASLVQLRQRGYIEATAWIIAQVADGLHHAHERGILHRDIKPSNILISAEGQPLLLDFNLAQHEQIDPELATLGGTVAYMAPEHLRALAGRSAALIRQVDQRSDIYSLGMVLAEMLTGQSPFDQSVSYSVVPLQIEAMAVERSASLPSVRQKRPDIPWGLESITRKCLAPDPARRYQHADHLAEDLRCFLDDRPLKHVPELSRAEQIRKFARRHPRLTSSGSVAAAAALILFAVGSALAGVRDLLGAAQARDRLRAHEQGTAQALCLVNTGIDLEDHLRVGVDVCEKTLALYALPSGKKWADHPDLPRLAPEKRRKLAEDRRELLMLLAAARVRLAPRDRAAGQRALELLDEAEAIGGIAPSCALWLERADHLERIGETARAADARRIAARTPATTARDHYALATTYARRTGVENYRRALGELDVALRLNPRDYWSSVQSGICHLELGELVLAAADFGQCIGVWPEFAWGYFNRGCVLARGGRKTEAIADYTEALRRDPGFAPAAINRGLALLELKRYKEALADFDRAVVLGRQSAMLDAGRGMALEGLLRHGEADKAFAAAFARVPPRPDQRRARLCWSYGFAVAQRLPESARAAFDDVLLQDPSHPEALYGRAMLAAASGQTDAAIAAFDRALESRPSFNAARRSRAVLLARQGEFERAARDINWCLDREPASGETLYDAACVAALAARGSPSPAALGQALELLHRALDQGIEVARAAADPDLAAIRPDERFHRLLVRSTPQAGRPSPEEVVR